MLDTGFLYICGHRAGIYDQTSKIYNALVNQALVPDWSNMERELETCCATCWSNTTPPALFGMRARVLERKHLDTTHVHSLLAMLYHLANRLLAEPDATLIKLLTKWTQCVATRYITNQAQQDLFQSAIWAVIPPLVAEDAISSIKTFRAPIDWPGVNETAVERGALAASFGRLQSRDHDLR